MKGFWGRLRRRSGRVSYGCGNCRETFTTEQAMHAHQPCPLVETEREIGEWNTSFLRRVLDDEAVAAEHGA